MDHSHLRVSLVTLGDPGRLTGGYLYHRRMAEAAPRHGAVVRFVSFPERPFPTAIVDAPAMLARAASGADAIVLDSIAAAFAGPWLAARRPPVPVIGSLHQPPGGIDHGPRRTAIQARLDAMAWRRARTLIVASEHLADQMRGLGYDPRRIVVVPPGRDVAPVPTGPLPDLREGRGAAVLCVANWLPRKGILDLLEAFSRLPQEAATLHLAGDDRVDMPHTATIRARLGAPDLAGRVVVHGPVSRERVAQLYAAADVFALPARREPYGTVWGEAMAMGLPVVGWRTENLPYLARDGEEALMANPGDLIGLTTALERLVTDEALRSRVGEAARLRANSRPTWDQSARLFQAALRR